MPGSDTGYRLWPFEKFDKDTVSEHSQNIT